MWSATEPSRYGQQRSRGRGDQRRRPAPDRDDAHADQREGERLVLDGVRDRVPDRVRDGGGDDREGDGEGKGARRVQRGSSGRLNRSPQGFYPVRCSPGC